MVFITDGNGHLVQHIQYVPFGEVFIEQRNSKWNTPYKFNGKELDEETGLAYYHARYYDPRTSVWLSVDPLAEKMPGFTSYHYCSNNPVMRIDPDGRSDEEVQEPSPAGLILETYLLADAAVFNFVIRAFELFGVRRDPNIIVRKELPYDHNGNLTSNENKIVERPVNSVWQETKEIAGDALSLYPGFGPASKGIKTQTIVLAKAPGAKSAIVTFIKKEGKIARTISTNLPEGYRLTKLKSQGQKVYTNGSNYITPDVTSHKGGVWKMFDKKKNVGSPLKQDRVGTFDEKLNRIGD